MFFPKDHLATYMKRSILLNVPVNTEVIDLEGDRKNASGHLARKRTKTGHFGADVSA